MLADAVSNFGQVATQQGRIIDDSNDSKSNSQNLELYNNQLEAKEGQLKLDESLSTDFNDKVVDIKTVLVMEQSTLNKQMKNSIHFHLKKFAELQPNLPGHAQEDLKNTGIAT